MFITTYLNLERCQVPNSREYRFLLEGTLVANPHNLVKIVVSFALVSQRPTSREAHLAKIWKNDRKRRIWVEGKEVILRRLGNDCLMSQSCDALQV